MSPPATGLDPAAWGDDHAGQPPPDYVTGGECLFCHRESTINSWNDNPHARTMRLADPGTSGGAELLLGAGDAPRLLTRTGYGKVALLGREGEPADENIFASSCAGCHSTAVDPRTLSFSSPSLDCYVCHGDVDLRHSTDPDLVLLSGSRRDHARVVISICAQCHVRSGRSRSSGLPYPNGFVAGDNLFRDFEVDLSDPALADVSVADRHVLENVRDVALRGDESVTCLSCHDVHSSSTLRHESVWQRESCFTCHLPGRDKSELRPFTRYSHTCAG